MKRLLASAAIVVGACWFWTPLAHAALTPVYCGPASDNSCESKLDQMVFLQAATGVTSGLGDIGGQKLLPLLDISSNGGLLNMIVDLKNGFSSIDPTNPATTYNGLTFSVPGFQILDISFSAQLTGTQFIGQGFVGANGVIPANTFTDQSNSSQGYSIGSGSTTAGFDSVQINSATGFEEVKHIEVALCMIESNGSCTTVIPPVPEPWSLALLGTGVLGLAAVRRRSA